LALFSKYITARFKIGISADGFANNSPFAYPFFVIDDWMLTK
jgi:hypothetical protein